MTLEQKIQLFIKIFIQEVTREFHFLTDVAAGRATRKNDFTDKLIGIIRQFAGSVADGVPGVGPITGLLGQLGAVGVEISTALNAIDHSGDLPKLSEGLGISTLWSIWHEQQKSAEIQNIAKKADLLDLQALEILLENTAREMAYRYEFFLATRLADETEAVIAFAKCGVTRAIEYLARTGKEITQETLLQGLIEGRSGQFIQGWSNTVLSGKGEHRRNKVTLTGEGAYGRSAFCIDQEGVKTLWIRDQSRHEAVCLDLLKKHHVSHALQQLRTALSHYGYVKYQDKKSKTYPKYGYAQVTQSIVQQYDYKPHINIDTKIERELSTYPWQRTFMNEQLLQAYLQQLKNKKPVRHLIQYIAQQEKYHRTQAVACRLDLSRWDLRGGDYSGVDFTGAVLSGNLSNTCFKEAILVGATFKNITSAEHADFTNAHCEYLTVEGAVNLSRANFTQTHFKFARLSGVDFSASETTGAHWYKAQLDAVKGNAHLLVEQQEQMAQIEKEAQAQRQALEKLQEEVIEQGQLIQAWAERLNPILDKIQSEAEQEERVKTLQQQVTQLLQAQTARLSFEQYCEKQLSALKAKDQLATRSDLEGVEEEIKALQDIPSNRQSLLSFFQETLEQLQEDYPHLQTLCKQLQGDFNQLNQELRHELAVHQQRIDKLSHEFQQCSESFNTRIEQLEASEETQNRRLDALEARVRPSLFNRPTVVGQDEIDIFIEHVLDDNQDEVREMLKSNRRLALEKSSRIERNGMIFDKITACDCILLYKNDILWNIVKEYLPPNVSQEKMDESENKSITDWVSLGFDVLAVKQAEEKRLAKQMGLSFKNRLKF